MFAFGFSQREITPALGMGIPGYFEARHNRGVKDPLFAKAAAMEAGGERCALVVCDTIHLELCDQLAIRKRASDLCGIPPERIFVWATHTHTGGPVGRGGNQRREKAYIDMLARQAAEAVAEAWARRISARIGFASGQVPGISFIRRFCTESGGVVTNPPRNDPSLTGPDGTPDETLTIARVDDAASGTPIAFLANFGVHLDTVGGELISADYPGVLAERVRQEYGEHVACMFFTGPCGNTNHLNRADPSTYTDPDMPVRIGNALFAKLRELDRSLMTREEILQVGSKRFLWELQTVTKQRAEWGRGVLEGTIHAEPSKMFDPALYARAAVDIYARIESVREVEVGAVRLGDNWIFAWPCEMFVEFGRAVRAAQPGRQLLIGELAAGSFYGYVPTLGAYERGGYETLPSGVHCCKPGLGERIEQVTLELIAQMERKAE